MIFRTDPYIPLRFFKYINRLFLRNSNLTLIYFRRVFYAVG